MDTGLAFRVALAKANESQAWLARETGYSRVHINKLCNGNGVPSLDLIEEVCQALDMKMSEFVKGGEE